MPPAAGPKWRYEFLIGLAIMASYGLVSPIGDYAVLDDWAFDLSLKHLHDEGKLQIAEWNPMSLVGHLFWGLLFTKSLGFSLTTTKVAVVVLHFVECVALFRLLMLCGTPAAGALGAVAVLIVQPLHFPHCYMNMTDVPLLTWQVVSLLLYVNGLARSRRSAWLWLALGSLTSGYAYLIRQSGCLVPLALFVYCVVWDRKRLRPGSVIAAFGPAALIAGAFEYWYRVIHGPTAAFLDSTKVISAFLLAPPMADLPYILLTFFMQLGLFVAPLAIAVPLRREPPPQGARRSPALAIGMSLGGALLIGVWGWYAFGQDRFFPYIRNVITPYGLSCPNEFVVGDRDLLWGKGTGWTISVASLLGMLLLLRRVVDEPVEALLPARTVGRRLASILLAVQLAYLFATAPILFDRHLLMLLPTGIIVFCLTGDGLARLVGWRLIVCLIPLWLYSVTTTHDLHSLSRAASRAGDELIKQGIDPLQVNAGYAFDCWHTYERRKSGIINQPVPPWWVKNHWKELLEVQPSLAFSIDTRSRDWWAGYIPQSTATRFAVSTSPPKRFSPDANVYRVNDRRPYANWWPFETKYVYFLERHPAFGDP